MISTKRIEKLAGYLNQFLQNQKMGDERARSIFAFLMQELPGARRRYADCIGPTRKLKTKKGD